EPRAELVAAHRRNQLGLLTKVARGQHRVPSGSSGPHLALVHQDLGADPRPVTDRPHDKVDPYVADDDQPRRLTPHELDYRGLSSGESINTTNGCTYSEAAGTACRSLSHETGGIGAAAGLLAENLETRREEVVDGQYGRAQDGAVLLPVGEQDP